MVSNMVLEAVMESKSVEFEASSYGVLEPCLLPFLGGSWFILDE
jgi:hypothetical protein